MSFLFGTSNTQEQSTQIPPELQEQLQQALGGLQQQTAAFGPQAQEAAGQFQTGFSQFAPQLQTDFARFQQPTELDTRAQSLVSQGRQGLQQQAAAQQRGIANQFRGQPGVSNILRQQAQTQSALQQNPLLFQAAQEQQGRSAEQFRFNQQAQQLSNQALLGQGAEAARLQGLGNQALTQRLGIQSAPLQQQFNLTDLLGRLGAQFGTTRTSGRSGGLF